MPAGLALSPSVRVWLLGLEQSPSVQRLLVRVSFPCHVSARPPRAVVRPGNCGSSCGLLVN